MASARPRPAEFGKYRLVQRLARGGMAEIWRAKYVGAAGITKSVVLKKILPTYAGNERFVQMFVDEAKITVGLSHGNIAQVFDFGELGGEYFLAMEYVHGQSLSRVQRRAEELELVVPVPIACFVVMEMCKGLHYAHRKTDERGAPLGIVHRDVSPQNVMLSYEGQVKIVDFGIAKAATVAGQTEAGALKGKYLYFAPEQARGRTLDGRADLFATGIVLYELLTGRRPFEGQLLDVLRAIVEGHFVRPSRVNPEIPPSLEAIVLKAMARQPEDRFQTGLELQEALAGFLYTAAPRFTSANLAQYMQYLYYDELVAEGLSVDLPPEFLEQVPLWKRPERALRGPGPGGSRSSSRGTPSHPSGAGAAVERGPTSADVPSARERAVAARPKRWRRWALMALVPLATAGIVAGAVVSATRAVAPVVGAGLVAVQTTPAGASIFLDGQDTGERTPHAFEGLMPGRTYGLTLRLEGYRPFLRGVTPSARGAVDVRETLVRLPDARPTPAAEGTEESLRRQVREAARDESVVRPKSFGATLEHLAVEMGRVERRGKPDHTTRFDLRRQVLDVRRLPALRVRLDPKRSYRVSLSGAVYVDDPLVTPGVAACFYVVDRGGREEVGLTTSESPLEIAKGARAAYFVIADADPKDDTGKLLLRLTDDRDVPRDVVLDARRNAFSPRTHRIRVLEDLLEFQDYRASLEGAPAGAPPVLFVRRPVIAGITGFGSGMVPMGVLENGSVFRGAKDVMLFSLTARGRPPRGGFEIRFAGR